MIVITGGAGFIGSCLAHRLAGPGRNLLIVDEGLSPEKAANLPDRGRLRLLRPTTFLERLKAGAVKPTVLFHLGACSSTTETNWEYLYQNNFVFSQRLWQYCAATETPFYYASSAATYGDGSLGFDDHLPPEKLTPLNLYGRSKNDFDRWALAQVAQGGASPSRWAGLKFFNVYGPREAHKGSMASVVWQARRQIQERGEVRLFRSTDPNYPDGGQLRDFVFVDDCVDHMIWLWKSMAPNGLYNSGVGRARTFLDLASAVFAALGARPRIEFIDTPPKLALQYQNFTQAEMSKLREAGYEKLATSLEDGVRQTIREYPPLEKAA